MSRKMKAPGVDVSYDRRNQNGCPKLTCERVTDAHCDKVVGEGTKSREEAFDEILIERE